MGAKSKQVLAPRIGAAHPTDVFSRARMKRIRFSPNRTPLAAIAAFVLVFSAVPLRPCLCVHEAPAAASERPCHSDRSKPAEQPVSGHGCEHVGCSALSASLASIKQSPSLLPPMSAPSAAVPAFVGSQATVPHGLLLSFAHGPPKLGPSIPEPLFTVLRP
jgi:hypothetical protein